MTGDDSIYIYIYVYVRVYGCVYICANGEICKSCFSESACSYPIITRKVSAIAFQGPSGLPYFSFLMLSLHIGQILLIFSHSSIHCNRQMKKKGGEMRPLQHDNLFFFSLSLASLHACGRNAHKAAFCTPRHVGSLPGKNIFRLLPPLPWRFETLESS